MNIEEVDMNSKSRPPKGYWTCKTCGTFFEKPEDFHQRICNDCLSVTHRCSCSDKCKKEIKKYYKHNGKIHLYALGHSPKERKARIKNGAKVWDVPGFREKQAESVRSANKRLMKDEKHVKALRQRMIKINSELWKNPGFRKMHENKGGKYTKAALDTWADPERRKRQSELMKKMSLKWWSDPSTRDKKIAQIKNQDRDVSLEKNPNWRGGLSFEPYPSDFNEALKEKIRDREQRQCFICGLHEKDHHRNLAIHHVDYDKNNCTASNLVALCDFCHGKTSHNRKHWKILIKQMIKARYSDANL